MNVSLAEVYGEAVRSFQNLLDTHLAPKSFEYRVLHSKCLDQLAICASKIDTLGLYDELDISDVTTNELRYLNVDYMLGVAIEKTPIDISNTTHIARISVAKIGLRKYLEFVARLIDLGFHEDEIFDEMVSKSFPDGQKGPMVIELETSQVARVKNIAGRQLAAYQKRLMRLLESTTQPNKAPEDEGNFREIEVLRLQVLWSKSWFQIQSSLDELRMLSGMSDENAEFIKSNTVFVPSAFLNHTALDELIREASIGPTFEKFKEHLDERMQNKTKAEDNSTRVDRKGQANGKTGEALLGPDGKVNRPFIVSDRNALEVLKQVKGTGQKLPTITVEELVNRELANSLRSDIYKDIKQDDSDEDSDKKTMEQRLWDDFKEANPRGSGNTMNLG